MCLVFLGRYSSDSQAIKDAIATVEQISCVRFKTRTNEQYYIKFVRGNGLVQSIINTENSRDQKQKGQKNNNRNNNKQL